MSVGHCWTVSCLVSVLFVKICDYRLTLNSFNTCNRRFTSSNASSQCHKRSRGGGSRAFVCTVCRASDVSVFAWFVFLSPVCRLFFCAVGFRSRNTGQLGWGTRGHTCHETYLNCVVWLPNIILEPSRLMSSWEWWWLALALAPLTYLAMGFFAYGGSYLRRVVFFLLSRHGLLIFFVCLLLLGFARFFFVYLLLFKMTHSGRVCAFARNIWVIFFFVKV